MHDGDLDVKKYFLEDVKKYFLEDWVNNVLGGIQNIFTGDLEKEGLGSGGTMAPSVFDLLHIGRTVAEY
jgi:hypothetical protein